jgi:hypothetical protein
LDHDVPGADLVGRGQRLEPHRGAASWVIGNELPVAIAVVVTALGEGNARRRVLVGATLSGATLGAVAEPGIRAALGLAAVELAGVAWQDPDLEQQRVEEDVLDVLLGDAGGVDVRGSVDRAALAGEGRDPELRLTDRRRSRRPPRLAGLPRLPVEFVDDEVPVVVDVELVGHAVEVAIAGGAALGPLRAHPAEPAGTDRHAVLRPRLALGGKPLALPKPSDLRVSPLLVDLDVPEPRSRADADDRDPSLLPGLEHDRAGVLAVWCAEAQADPLRRRAELELALRRTVDLRLALLGERDHGVAALAQLAGDLPLLALLALLPLLGDPRLAGAVAPGGGGRDE